MDLRALYVLISTAVVALGVVVGWRDAQRINASSAAVSALPLEVEPAPEWPRPRKTKSRESLWDENGVSELAGWDDEDRGDEEADGEPRVDTGADGEASGGVGADELSTAVERLHAEGTRLSPGMERRLERIDRLVAAQQYTAAADAAAGLARQSAGPARVRAIRLQAKALAFQELVPEVGAPGRAPPPSTGGSRGKLLDLANGSTVAATRVVEEPDRYDVTFAGGETRTVLREDVLAVRDGDVSGASEAPSAAAPAAWAQLGPKIESLEHPIDIYIQGVKKCYELGLRDEGYKLMDRLLAMANSDNIPLLFADENSPQVYHYWRVAAGREPVSSEVDDPLALAGDAAAASRRSSIPDPPLSANDSDALTRATRMVSEGRERYRQALGREGAQDEIRAAYEQLRKAQEILGLLPPTDATRQLTRDLGQLLQDVAKALPFF